MTNCLVGLVVVPYERLYRKNPQRYGFLSNSLQELSMNEIMQYRENLPFSTFSFQIKEAGQNHFQNFFANDITVLQFFSGIRNSISHGSISHENEDGQIARIKFSSETPESYRDESGHTIFEISFEVRDYIDFIKQLVHTLNEYFL